MRTKANQQFRCALRQSGWPAATAPRSSARRRLSRPQRECGRNRQLDRRRCLIRPVPVRFLAGSGRLNRERSAPPRDIAVVDEMLTSFIEQQPAG